METPDGTIYRFGPFEVDTSAGELLKQGKRVGLQEQPFRLLMILIENSGEVVSRAEIQSRVWGENTFVDFDSSLRVAVGKLRTALGDDAADPRYIETIPKRGYRFLGPASRSTVPLENSVLPNVIAAPSSAEASAGLTKSNSGGARFWPSRRGAFSFTFLLLASIGVVAFVFQFRGKRPLTERDTVVLASFTNTTGDAVLTRRYGKA